MKKAYKLLALLLVAVTAVTMTSCKKDTNESVQQFYRCRFKIHSVPGDVLTDTNAYTTCQIEHDSLLGIYTQLFGADTNRWFSITAKDTIELIATVRGLCLQKESQLAAADWSASHEILVGWQKDDTTSGEIYSIDFGPVRYTGGSYSTCELKKRIHVRNRYDNYYRWQDLPFSNTSEMICGIWVYMDCQWQMDEDIDFETDSPFRLDLDLNRGCGATTDNIYLYPVSREYYPFITDLILLNSDYRKNHDFSMEYEGRTYYMIDWFNEKEGGDLNNSAGGPYLYLMRTHDTRGGKKRRLCNMRAHYSSSRFSVPHHTQVSDDVENEVISMVNWEGQVVQENGDFAKGTGGDYIYIECKYVSVNSAD